MNCHLEITEEGKRVLVDELHIRTDLDLRGLGATEAPAPALEPEQVQWINVPVAPYGHLGDAGNKEQFRKVFEVFADPSNYPVIFHCWGGADRSGSMPSWARAWTISSVITS